MGDLAWLLVRVVVGLLLAGHGVQKLSRRLGGSGVERHAEMLEGLGYRPGRPWALAHGVVEVGAGVMLAAGMATPIAAGLILAVMLNAIVVVDLKRGLWAHNGGMQYRLVLSVVAVSLGIAGPGRYAVDAALGIAPTQWWAWGAIIGGLIVGAGVLSARHLRLGRRRAAA